MKSLIWLALVHMAANALLLGVGYYWLGGGESSTSILIWSATLAAFLLLAAIWTYSAALAYFAGDGERDVLAAWRKALRHLVPLSVVFAASLVFYSLLALWSPYTSTPAFKVASWLTLTIQAPVRPSAVQWALVITLWILRWAAMPVMLLPMLSEIAVRGWRGFRSFGTRWRNWKYWLATPLLSLGAFWLPFKIMSWSPRFSSFGVEMASFVARASLAYLLFAGCWLALAAATSAGKPRLTQPSTTVSP